MQPVTVTLGDRTYPIHIGTGLLGDETLYAKYIASKRVAVLTPSRVAPLYLGQVQSALERAGGRVVPILIEDGEQAKAWGTLDRVVDAMLAARCNVTRSAYERRRYSSARRKLRSWRATPGCVAASTRSPSKRR